MLFCFSNIFPYESWRKKTSIHRFKPLNRLQPAPDQATMVWTTNSWEVSKLFFFSGEKKNGAIFVFGVGGESWTILKHQNNASSLDLPFGVLNGMMFGVLKINIIPSGFFWHGFLELIFLGVIFSNRMAHLWFSTKPFWSWTVFTKTPWIFRFFERKRVNRDDMGPPNEGKDYTWYINGTEHL